jgi:hypothetical protein
MPVAGVRVDVASETVFANEAGIVAWFDAGGFERLRHTVDHLLAIAMASNVAALLLVSSTPKLLRPKCA